MSARMTAGEIAHRPARVVIADDEGLLRASLRQLLGVPPSVLTDVYGVDVGPGFEVVGEAGSGFETVQIVRAVNPDLLLLDLQMPRMNGLEALCDLAVRNATPPTLLLAGAIDRTHMLNAVRLGVRGFVLKEFTTELIFEAMMCVLAGQYWLGPTLVTDFMESVRPLIQPAPSAVPGGAALTRREREVIALVVSGCANKDIAREFSVSEETVKHHLTRIFDKVGAANRVELAMVARTYGLVDAVDPLPDAHNAAIARS